MTEEKQKSRIAKKRRAFNDLSQEWGLKVRPEETVVSSANSRKRLPEEMSNTSASFHIIHLHFNILSVKQ